MNYFISAASTATGQMNTLAGDRKGQ